MIKKTTQVETTTATGTAPTTGPPTPSEPSDTPASQQLPKESKVGSTPFLTGFDGVKMDVKVTTDTRPSGLGTWMIRCLRPHGSAISVAAVVAIALVAVSGGFSAPIKWNVDALFYQAQVYQLRGDSQTTALHRAFSGPGVAAVERYDERLWHVRITDPRLERLNAPFYRRRWVVPIVAALLYPLAGIRSLSDASIIGYVVAGMLLFALLRRRFSVPASFGATAVCLLLPPLRGVAPTPMTDTWALALEAGALLAAILALERGGWWLAVFGGVTLLLSFTRDAAIVLVIGTACLWLAERSRRRFWLFGTSVLASIPAPLLFGAPLLRELTRTLTDGRQYDHPASWSFVLAHLPARLVSVLHSDLVYPGALGHPHLWYSVALALIVAVVYTFIRAPRHDPYFVLLESVLIGGILTVALAATYTDLRLELVFVPLVAVAIAFALQSAAGQRKRMSVSSWPTATARQGSRRLMR